jgi:class 3 adenylate cyclase
VHRSLRRHLENATGASVGVVALNLDIRGFSTFSREVDAVDAAAFLKRAYLGLLDGPFKDASWFKLTGDGMMVVYTYTPETVETVAPSVTRAATDAIQLFDTIADNDPMVNFLYPKLIGIGMARGSASRIFDGRVTLDFSGRVLNLASRLMDMARPRGLVIDEETFGRTLIDPNLIPDLRQEFVYVRGISEDTPRPVLFDQLVELEPRFKQPMLPARYVQIDVTSLTNLRALAPNWIIDLKKTPRDPSDIKVRASYPRRVKGFPLITFLSVPVKRYQTPGNSAEVVIEVQPLLDRLTRQKVRSPATQVRMEISYIPVD